MCLTPNMWKVQLDVDKIAKSGQDDAMTVLQLFRTQSKWTKWITLVLTRKLTKTPLAPTMPSDYDLNAKVFGK